MGQGAIGRCARCHATSGGDPHPTVGLAKQNEEIYVPARPAPVILPRSSQGLYLVQRIRDEAHRFAISYHRKLRDSQTTKSLLDEIPGVGPRRRRALIDRFGSLEGIRQATVDELAAVPGMNHQVAEQIKSFL